MKGKKVFIIIALITIIVAMIGILKILNGNLYGLKKSGNLYDNISDFTVLSVENPDELTRTYLENITYEITNIDIEKMTVTIEMQIPQISDVLSKVLDKVILESKDAEYDELKELAKKELTKVLKSETLDRNIETLTFSVEKIDGSYKINPSQEWNALITGNLEQLYLEYLKTLIGGMTGEIRQ